MTKTTHEYWAILSKHCWEIKTDKREAEIDRQLADAVLHGLAAYQYDVYAHKPDPDPKAN